MLNSVNVIGRLTRDPEVRRNGDLTVANFTLAIDRPPKKDGSKETDFPRITVFGKQAENCEKYIRKGSLVCIVGRIQTGSYTNRDGQKVYTTDIVANSVQFLDPKSSNNTSNGNANNAPAPRPTTEPAPAPAAAPAPEAAPAPAAPAEPAPPAPQTDTSQWQAVDDDEEW